ncbi:TaqI-like C-terminal specificity domain-containing protein [Elizabethkingia anophelis]|uniref:TaqI-like C-terminal specificity domain-containing protein n=1 Tax=Elizabethkingia anophelis TaxID=1117645 RepID=UPI0009B7CBFB|nr:TaqI-like C-terminal specificity domain-containing protein [Elizabethkingia anophelis]
MKKGPILRGRDIKKYGLESSDLWLLFIPWHFPFQNNPEIKGASQLAENQLSESYPAIYKHLLSFKEQLSNRNKAETGVRYEWYALQRWGANYWEDFSKQKIVWGEISDKAKFAVDIDGQYVNEATTFLMVGNSLLYLVVYLNSKLSEYFFSKIGTTTGVGTVRWKKFTIEQLLVPKIDKEIQLKFENYALEIIELIKLGKDYSQIDKCINTLIYQVFCFSKEEIQFIENQ